MRQGTFTRRLLYWLSVAAGLVYAALILNGRRRVR